MRVAMVLCPVWHIKTPPIGLGYLIAYLKKKGHDPIAYDFNIELYHNVNKSNKSWWDFRMPEDVRRHTLNHEIFSKDKFLDMTISGWVKRIIEDGCEAYASQHILSQKNSASNLRVG